MGAGRTEPEPTGTGKHGSSGGMGGIHGRRWSICRPDAGVSPARWSHHHEAARGSQPISPSFPRFFDSPVFCAQQVECRQTLGN